MAESETDALARIFVTLRSVFRVDFANYRTSTIRRRVERRMALLKMDSIDEYAAYLGSHRDEVEELYHDVLIMVTEFFREPEVYDALLAKVLPNIVEAEHGDDQIRLGAGLRHRRGALQPGAVYRQGSQGCRPRFPHQDLRHRHQRARHRQGAHGAVQREQDAVRAR